MHGKSDGLGDSYMNYFEKVDGVHSVEIESMNASGKSHAAT